MLTDYHVHLESGPYTLDWMKEYINVANKKGITELGFSEHGYRFKQSKKVLLNPWIEERQTEDIEKYVSLVLEAKKLGLPVKLGIEMDYIPGKEAEISDFLKPYPWDYIIGSVHWINEWGFDLHEMRDKWEGQSIITIYQKYFAIIEQLLESKLFDILGHVDVIKVFGHKPEDKDAEIIVNIYQSLVSKIKASDITVEMSTAGLRKPVQELYPSEPLMKQLAAYQIPMIINSDAHRPDHVGADYDKGIKYFKDFGINKIHIFNNRTRTAVPLG